MAAPLYWAVIVLAAATAVGLTAYVGINATYPRWLTGMPRLGIDLSDNLTSAVVFFWLDVLVIAIGLKALDGLSQYIAVRARFYDLYAAIKPAVEQLWDKRYDFAVALDDNRRADGGYDVDYGKLNEDISAIKVDFTNKILCDISMNDHGRIVVDRVFRALDSMTEFSYDLGAEADRIDAAIKPIHEKAADDGSPSPAPLAERVRNEELEATLNRLFELTDPTVHGLERLKSSLRHAAKTLKLGRLDADEN